MGKDFFEDMMMYMMLSEDSDEFFLRSAKPKKKPEPSVGSGADVLKTVVFWLVLVIIAAVLDGLF